jgi:cold shock CspA family protein
MTGRIAQVVRSRSCGFIRAADGQEVFFHASSLLDVTLDQVVVRAPVQFTLIPDAISGPRAAEVRIDRRVSKRAS